MNEMRKLMETVEEGLAGDLAVDIGRKMTGKVSKKETIVRVARSQIRAAIAEAEASLDAGTEESMRRALTNITVEMKKLDTWLRHEGK